MTALLVVGIVLAVIWVVAIVDMIGATEMESTGRLILAGVLIFLPPIGLLIWMAVRGGTLGKLAATALASVAVGVTVVVVTGVSSSSNGAPRVMHVEGAGTDVWVHNGVQYDPTGPRDHPPGHPGVTGP